MHLKTKGKRKVAKISMAALFLLLGFLLGKIIHHFVLCSPSCATSVLILHSRTCVWLKVSGLLWSSSLSHWSAEWKGPLEVIQSNLSLSPQKNICLRSINLLYQVTAPYEKSRISAALWPFQFKACSSYSSPLLSCGYGRLPSLSAGCFYILVFSSVSFPYHWVVQLPVNLKVLPSLLSFTS